MTRVSVTAAAVHEGSRARRAPLASHLQVSLAVLLVATFLPMTGGCGRGPGVERVVVEKAATPAAPIPNGPRASTDTPRSTEANASEATASESTASEATAARPDADEPQTGTTGETGATGETAAVRLPDAYPAEFSAGKVELRDPAGNEILSFKPRPPSALTVRDAQNQELGRFTLSEGRLKATGPDGKPAFELKRKDDKVMLKDATGDVELFKFKLKGRDIDVYAPGDMLIYRLRHKDYGYALEDARDQTLFRAKTKEDKRVLRDLNDQTVLYSKDLPAPLGLLFFRLSQFTPLQQAACCVYFQQQL